MLEVHAAIARDQHNFCQLVVFLVHKFRTDQDLLERWSVLCLSKSVIAFIISWGIYVLTFFLYAFRRGALIIRRLCVLLDSERVYRELSKILEGEADLDFASTMVQVSFLLFSYKTPNWYKNFYPCQIDVFFICFSLFYFFTYHFFVFHCISGIKFDSAYFFWIIRPTGSFKAISNQCCWKRFLSCSICLVEPFIDGHNKSLLISTGKP